MSDFNKPNNLVRMFNNMSREALSPWEQYVLQLNMIQQGVINSGKRSEVGRLLDYYKQMADEPFTTEKVRALMKGRIAPLQKIFDEMPAEILPFRRFK